jgi:uncharacterized surface protein with fasciclin (FAS1) repeats
LSSLPIPGFAADQKDIYETIGASPNHTILLSAIKESKLEVTLSAKGSYTFFAPTDEAFKKLSHEQLTKLIEDKDLLRKIVLAHLVVAKALTKDDLKALPGHELNGFKITAEEGVKIGDAKIVTADLKCSNGILHSVDTVLMPKSTD